MRLASFPGLPLPLYYSKSILEEERKNKRGDYSFFLPPKLIMSSIEGEEGLHRRRKMLGLRGATFFKQLKYDFFLLLVDTNEEKCQ